MPHYQSCLLNSLFTAFYLYNPPEIVPFLDLYFETMLSDESLRQNWNSSKVISFAFCSLAWFRTGKSLNRTLIRIVTNDVHWQKEGRKGGWPLNLTLVVAKLWFVIWIVRLTLEVPFLRKLKWLFTSSTQRRFDGELFTSSHGVDFRTDLIVYVPWQMQLSDSVSRNSWVNISCVTTGMSALY